MLDHYGLWKEFTAVMYSFKVVLEGLEVFWFGRIVLSFIPKCYGGHMRLMRADVYGQEDMKMFFEYPILFQL